MVKRFFIFSFLLLFVLIFPKITLAKTNSFVSIVNPVRGSEFWDLKDQQPITTVLGQSEILNKQQLPSTWLVRYDALGDVPIIELLKKRTNDEKGLFLEILPSWTKAAGVSYHQSPAWHLAASVFLTGYSVDDRHKLVDKIFEEFKNKFGYYPKSVGAWWIDANSLAYMQQKYDINAALIVADQYSTDDYQIWGQYWGSPYYPSKENTLHPAQKEENKIPVVITQWAVRDPFHGYGKGVEESTYSVQANDYIDYHDLDINYFSKLVDIYTKQPYNQVNQIVVGLENSYDWSKYQSEYQKQIEVLKNRSNQGQLSVVNLTTFGSWYRTTFTGISPDQLIVAEDPFDARYQVIWYMNPYYRAGLFANSQGMVFRDIRQYVEGTKEPCLEIICTELNFATFSTRVLDEVTYGHKWLLDQAPISKVSIQKQTDKVTIKYLNAQKETKTIELLPRDISYQGKVSSIDGAILDASTKGSSQNDKVGFFNNQTTWSSNQLLNIIFGFIKYILFIVLVIITPGFILFNLASPLKEEKADRLFLSLVIGLVSFILISFFSGLIHAWWLIWIYLCLVWLLGLVKKMYLHLSKLTLNKQSWWFVVLITLGTTFQLIPVFRSGLIFNYGVGLWGPNTHDGVWHLSLVNQILAGLPPQNPIFSGEILRNYHYFYDLLIAATSWFIQTDSADLIFRFYPLLFSLALGWGVYGLMKILFKEQLTKKQFVIAASLALYFGYFAGSFGWIVDYLKSQSFGGESAFWANQAVSFNLNPPFAISLIVFIALIQLIVMLEHRWRWPLAVIVGLLMVSSLGLKAYLAVLVFASLGLISILQLLIKRNWRWLSLLILSGLSLLVTYLPHFKTGGQIFFWNPFWFVHSMEEIPDRVGWLKLAQARTTYWQRGDWFRLILAEALGLFIFIVGNLGLRVFGLFILWKIIKVKSSFVWQFLLLFSGLSFLLPLLLTQNGNPWNTIQFMYYGLFIVGILSAVVIGVLTARLAKGFLIVILLMVLILTPINSLSTAKGYLYPKPHAFISQEELAGLQILASQAKGTVLTYPYNKNSKITIQEPWPLFAYETTAYVSAFSKQATFLEDEIQNEILATDYKNRRVASTTFFSHQQRQFLIDNKISYLYLPKFYKVSLDEQKLGLTKLLENDQVLVYRVN